MTTTLVIVTILLVISVFLILFRQRMPGWVSWLVVIMSTISALLCAIQSTSLISMIITLFFVWMTISNVRLVTHRRDAYRRLHVVRKSWVMFIGAVILLYIISSVLNDTDFVTILGLLSTAGAVLMLVFALYHAFVYNTGSVTLLNSKDLPTVTLAYPARNETHALEETLRSAVDSDYKKLEILAIDDCSQDRTPQIIRNFAHEGVRFVEGITPPDNWLGKNAAYRTLTEDASGEYILFSGVDVRLSPRSIDKLVAYAIKNNLDMVSVMPQRIHFDFLANFLQTTRYYFQFVLPWEILPVSPVLSSLWLIKRDSLSRLGGFERVPTMVVPERYFANALSSVKKYRFVVSDSSLGVTTRKKTSSQFDTATRTLYPMLGENPILALLVSLALLGLFFVPFVLTLYLLFGIDTLISDYALVSAGLLVLSNLVVYTRFNSASWFIGLFNFPFIIILELTLVQWSMLKYEFSTVLWKNRNICIPVLNPPLRRQRNSPI